MLRSPDEPADGDGGSDVSRANSSIRSLHAIVSGRVQGVGFRFFVYGAARRLGLTGSVCNLADGRVEVLARGKEAGLAELVRLLETGPPLSRVDHLDCRWDVAVPESAEFVIGF